MHSEQTERLEYIRVVQRRSVLKRTGFAHLSSACAGTARTDPGRARLAGAWDDGVQGAANRRRFRPTEITFATLRGGASGQMEARSLMLGAGG